MCDQAEEKIYSFIKYLETETQRSLGTLQRHFYSTYKEERLKQRARYAKYYIAGSHIKNYTTGNQIARQEIKKVTKFIIKNVKERLPRLNV